MRHRKGDRVRVKRFDGIPRGWSAAMLAFAGKTVTIGSSSHYPVADSTTILYWIEENSMWFWSADDFEAKDSLPANDPNIKFRVKKEGRP